MKTFSVAALLAIASVEAADTCRALALSGGGSNGAWETGVLWGFVHYGNPADFTYDVVTGVSAGSINTSALAGWTPGTEVEASEWLSDLWKNLTTPDVWKEWPWGLTEGLLTERGIVDNSPLLAYLDQHIHEKFSDYGRKVSISAANVNTGEYTTFDQTNTDFSVIQNAAVSSASIPAIFPNFQWEGKGVFMDGGTVYNINVESAIQQCLDVVDDESKIILDVLICGDAVAPVEGKSDKYTWENFLRAHSLSSYYNGSNDLAQSMKTHPNVNWRYTIQQEDSLGGLNEIHFEGDLTWPIQEKGREQAQSALNSSSMNLTPHFHEYNSNISLKREFPHIQDFLIHKKSQQSESFL